MLCVSDSGRFLPPVGFTRPRSVHSFRHRRPSSSPRRTPRPSPLGQLALDSLFVSHSFSRSHPPPPLRLPDCSHARSGGRCGCRHIVVAGSSAARPVQSRLMGAVRNVQFSIVPCLQNGGRTHLGRRSCPRTVRLTGRASDC